MVQSTVRRLTELKHSIKPAVDIFSKQNINANKIINSTSAMHDTDSTALMKQN